MQASVKFFFEALVDKLVLLDHHETLKLFSDNRYVQVRDLAFGITTMTAVPFGIIADF